MTSTGETVFGKIMLFGEYGVLSQGRALTIPLKNFSGTLRFPDENPNERQAVLNKLLFTFHDYLSARETASNHFGISLKTFEKELKDGLYFDSDIPNGYGAGSSGALVAAVYRRFGLEKPALCESNNFQELQKNLAALEAYFHGSSSGIDPLSCYLGVPLEFSPTEGAWPVNITMNIFPQGASFFLLNTGFPRKTEELVKLFRKKTRDEAFQKMMVVSYNATVSSCISNFLWGHLEGFEESMNQLSELQYCHFIEMIPDSIKEIWMQGLKQNLFTLKLCGAGGGGYILGYARDFSILRKVLKKYHILEIAL